MLKPLFVLALLALGCSPARLVVRHQDPENQPALVYVDGRREAILDVGQEATLALTPGIHQVRVTDEHGKRPWHPSVETLEVVVDQGAVLTLLPPRTEGGR